MTYGNEQQKRQHKIYMRKWYRNHSERVKGWAKRYRLENPEKCKAADRLKYQRNKAIRVMQSRLNNRRGTAELQDWYVRSVLTQRTELVAADIPQEMVEAKREQLKIRRLRNGSNNTAKRNASTEEYGRVARKSV